MSLHSDLVALEGWLHNRIWPQGFGVCRDSLNNFQAVLHDLLWIFPLHAEEVQGLLITQRFHKVEWFEEERYQELFQEYRVHICVIEKLVLELTKAANLVCDAVRTELSPSFRIAEGKAVAVFVNYFDEETAQFYNRRVVSEYDAAGAQLYPGLAQLKALCQEEET